MPNRSAPPHEGNLMTAEPHTTTRRRLAGLVLATGTLLGGGLAVTGSASAAPVEIFDTAIVRRADIVPITLGCEVVDRDAPSIGCRWSTPDAAAGYRLVRLALGTDQGRTVVARIDDPSVNSFVDTPVRRGIRYRYVVQAYDAAGRLIGASRAAHVGVPSAEETVDVEALRLECEATSPTSVRCAGSVPSTPARTLTLWRSVDGGEREVAESFASPFPSSYGDVVREGTRQVRYAIIATDGDGEIVARSRAEAVRMPEVDDPTPSTLVPVRPPATIDVRPVTTDTPQRPIDEPERDAERPTDTRPTRTTTTTTAERPTRDG